MQSIQKALNLKPCKKDCNKKYQNIQNGWNTRMEKLLESRE